MNKKELKDLTIKTGIVLRLEPEQISFLYITLKLAYTSGRVDGHEEITKLLKEQDTEDYFRNSI